MCTQTYSDIFSKNFCVFITHCFSQTLRSITQPWYEVACPGGLTKVATAENPCPWMAICLGPGKHVANFSSLNYRTGALGAWLKFLGMNTATDGRVSCARLRSGVPVCYTASCMTQPGEEPGLVLQRAPGQCSGVRRSRRTGGYRLFLLHSWYVWY